MNKKFIITFMILMVFGVIISSTVFAATNVITSANSITGKSNAMMGVLCNVLKFVTGNVGKTIASFLLIGVGIGFFTAKVSWSVLIGFALGMAALFGAPAIVAALTGGDAITTICN